LQNCLWNPALGVSLRSIAEVKLFFLLCECKGEIKKQQKGLHDMSSPINRNKSPPGNFCLCPNLTGDRGTLFKRKGKSKKGLDEKKEENEYFI